MADYIESGSKPMNFYFSEIANNLEEGVGRVNLILSLKREVGLGSLFF